MKKLLASTTAALALTAVAVTGVPGAPGAPESAEAAGCSTWQYKVTSKAGVYDFTDLDEPAGNEWKSNAYRGYYLNARVPNLARTKIYHSDGTYRLVYDLAWGDVYNHKKERVNYGAAIHRSKLDYVTCW